MRKPGSSSSARILAKLGGLIPCEHVGRAVGAPELRYIGLPVQQSHHHRQGHPANAPPSAVAPAAPINPPVARLMVVEVATFATTPADPTAIQRRRRPRNWSL